VPGAGWRGVMAAAAVTTRRRHPRKLGARYGSWRVVGVERRRDLSAYVCRLRCVGCGRERRTWSTYLTPSKTMQSCCPTWVEEADIELPELHGAAVIDGHTPWIYDDRCWYLVMCHPEGLTLEQIGLAMGISREWVRQIEAAALRKLRDVCELREISVYRVLGRVE